MGFLYSASREGFEMTVIHSNFLQRLSKQFLLRDRNVKRSFYTATRKRTENDSGVSFSSFFIEKKVIGQREVIFSHC